MRRAIAILVLFLLLLLVVRDAAFHFDEERVIVKRQNQSAQRHWSLFYHQTYTYDDSSFKYEQDIHNIEGLIEPNNTLLTDKASSYYLAAQLPVFVKNVHAHHIRNPDWMNMLKGSHLCYIDFQEFYSEAESFILNQTQIADLNGTPMIKYWVINNDSRNLNLRYDCLATRSGEIKKGLQDLGRLIYEGEYFLLYELN